MLTVAGALLWFCYGASGVDDVFSTRCSLVLLVAGPRSTGVVRPVTLTRRRRPLFYFSCITDKGDIAKGRIRKPMRNVTLARLDMMFGTSKAIEKDNDDDSDDELYYKYEKDEPAGAILKFVANKYLEVYGSDNRRVS